MACVTQVCICETKLFVYYKIENKIEEFVCYEM